MMNGFVIEGLGYANFFARITAGLSESERKKIAFFVRDDEAFNFIAQRAPSCQLYRIQDRAKVPTPEEIAQNKPILFKRIHQDIIKSFEHMIDGAEYELCWQCYFSTLLYFSHAIKELNISKLIMCSGCGIYSKAAATASYILEIETRFTELANLPEKVFIDPQGTNASSLLAAQPELLDDYPDVDPIKHHRWMKKYVEEKRKVIPQAIGNPRSELIKQISQQTVLDSGNNFIFLPLQVSNDAQLWMYAKHKNQDAITHAVKRAAEKGYALAVKIHPAEMSEEEIRLVEKLRTEFGFYLTQESTNALIQAAESVITINSTVGLEAMLYSKQVEVLGDCFYKHFNASRLQKYIHHYLFSDVHFFGNTKINRKTAQAFLAR